LRRELEATEDLVIRLGKILSETALALKGPPPPLTRHSTHDLAEVARATVSQLDAMRRERDRLLKREEHFASVLRVTDSGQYRADWDSAIRRVVAERDALRAIAAGRDVLPTEAEALAHDENHGRWLVVSSDGQGTTMVDVCGLSAALLDPSRVLRVYALDAYHCLCAWPVVEVPRG
jgi:histidinol phosphatase-like PHP family hydrolase